VSEAELKVSVSIFGLTSVSDCMSSEWSKSLMILFDRLIVAGRPTFEVNLKTILVLVVIDNLSDTPVVDCVLCIDVGVQLVVLLIVVIFC